MLNDIFITCIDCNNNFIFTSLEVIYYKKHGYKYYPKRCSKCREKLHQKASFIPYSAICKKCHGQAILPFEPIDETTVLCEACYKKSRKK